MSARDAALRDIALDKAALRDWVMHAHGIPDHAAATNMLMRAAGVLSNAEALDMTLRAAGFPATQRQRSSPPPTANPRRKGGRPKGSGQYPTNELFAKAYHRAYEEIEDQKGRRPRDDELWSALFLGKTRFYELKKELDDSAKLTPANYPE